MNSLFLACSFRSALCWSLFTHSWQALPMNTALQYCIVSAMMDLGVCYMPFHHVPATFLLRPQNEFSSQIGEWSMTQDMLFDMETLKLLKPTGYMVKHYMIPDGTNVNLYIGYRDGAQKTGPQHSPKNCLPSSGWYAVSSEVISVPRGDRVFHAVAAVYQKEAIPELYVYWFEVGGAVVTNEYGMKVQKVLNSIRRGREDACLIRIPVQCHDSKNKAVGQVAVFLKTVQPNLRQALLS